MKEVNIYIRVHQVRDFNNLRIKYIGCLLLESEGKHKYSFMKNVNGSSQRYSMLRLVREGIDMLKEPCDIVVHTLNDITSKQQKQSNIWDEIFERVNTGGHKLSVSVWKIKDDKRKYIFNKLKRKIEGYMGNHNAE